MPLWRRAWKETHNIHIPRWRIRELQLIASICRNREENECFMGSWTRQMGWREEFCQKWDQQTKFRVSFHPVSIQHKCSWWNMPETTGNARPKNSTERKKKLHLSSTFFPPFYLRQATMVSYFLRETKKLWSVWFSKCQKTETFILLLLCSRCCNVTAHW